MNLSIAIILVFGSVFLLAGYVLFGIREGYLTDSARQELFKSRERLFQLVAQGRVRSDSAAYTSARDLINATIRYLHDLSVLRLVWGAMLSAREQAGMVRHVEERVNDHMQDVEPDVQQELDQIRADVASTLIWYALNRSVGLSLLVRLVLSIAALIWGLRRFALAVRDIGWDRAFGRALEVVRTAASALPHSAESFKSAPGAARLTGTKTVQRMQAEIRREILEDLAGQGRIDRGALMAA